MDERERSESPNPSIPTRNSAPSPRLDGILVRPRIPPNPSRAIPADILRSRSSFHANNSVTDTQLDGALDPLPNHRLPVPKGGQPTNFIHISAVDSVQGAYTIDPGLSPPAALRSSSYGYNGGENVLIASQKGNVNIRLFVLPSSYEQSMTSMNITSKNGSACVRVHDAEPLDASYIRGPLNVMIKASKKADIYIPRSFKGTLQMVTGIEGEVYYSGAVRAELAPVFSGNGRHQSFIGGLPVDKDNGQAWLGDQLTANANDMINIYYDDEGGVPSEATGKGYMVQLQHRLTGNSQGILTTNVSPTRPLHTFRVRIARATRAMIPERIRRAF